MQLTNAIEAVDASLSEADSVSAASKLSGMERIFCDNFIANGGNGEEAALAAGYAEGSAKVSACRLLCRKRVADYIIAQCQTFVQTALPVAIRALVEIAGDASALRKDRIKAATSLLEHGGMAAPKGGVQVNVGVQVNGQEAQRIIASVHEARSARLSGIPTAMTDNLRTIEGAVERLEEDGRGGDRIEGSRPAPVALPASPSENSPEIGNSDDALDRWREATKGEDDGT